MLHGISSTHRKGVNQMLGVWKPLMDRTPWWKYLRRPGPIKLHPKALIVAPQAFGPAMYWHMGEVDVFRVIQEVRHHYRVDPARVILVGHSMGGTGVVDVGLHRPHEFAGMVSIAGYPSRWIHDEISTGTLKPWERLRAQRYSPVFWARNGRHLGLIAVHGTLDGPQKSRMIVQALRKLGYPASLKIYPYGHAVYRLYLNRGQVYRATHRWRTPTAPKRVTFRTTRLRWNRAHWIRLDSRPHADRWSEVDGRLVGDGAAKVTTKNVDQLTLLLNAKILPKVVSSAPLRVTLDGDRMTVPRRASLTFHRRGGHWRPGRRRFRGPEVGVRFIVPNPKHPKRYLLVVAGTTARGVLRQHLLPWYLPDYVVYDQTVENKRGFRVLGPARRYLAAGNFNNRWRVPPTPRLHAHF